jgi:hypothetical protein
MRRSLGQLAFAAFVGIVAADPGMAQPDRNSANYIVPGCRAVKDTYEVGICHGTLEGIRFMGTPPLGKLFCPPENVVLGQLVRVVVNYIDARPQRMHESFKALAGEALLAAWPCKASPAR